MKNPEVNKMIKNMSPKEKREYIWEYYKFHIIGALIVIAIISSFIYSMATKQKEYYSITYVGDYVSQKNLINTKNEINKLILNNDKKRVVSLDSVFTDKNSLAAAPQSLEKLAAKITASDIDIAIVNKKFFQKQVSTGMFCKLQSLKGFSSLSKSNYEFLTKPNSSDHSDIYGIYIKNSSVLKKLDSKTNDNILVVITTSKNKDKAIKIIKTLLQ